MYKAVEGVSYVRYDQFGVKLDPSTKEEEEAKQFIADADDTEGFSKFVPANDGLYQKAMEMAMEPKFHGGRKDVDKKIEDMNDDEKEVFNLMEDELNIKEETGAIDDDFILMLNGGIPALEHVAAEKKRRANASGEDNTGVIVFSDENAPPESVGEHPMMIPNYKEKMAGVIALLEKQEEMRKQAQLAKEAKNVKKEIEVEKELKKMVNQKDLDDVFASYMQKEYQDEQIGDLEGDEGVNPLHFINDIEGEGEEHKEGEDPDVYDYGDLSEGDLGDEKPSNYDLLE